MLFLSKLSEPFYHNARESDFVREFHFAYWTRNVNLEKLAHQYSSDVTKVGRGSSLHVGPSNVPVNSLFTLAFSILSGSPTILRVPSKFSKEFSLFFRAFSEWQSSNSVTLPISVVSFDKNSNLLNPFFSCFFSCDLG